MCDSNRDYDEPNYYVGVNEYTSTLYPEQPVVISFDKTIKPLLTRSPAVHAAPPYDHTSLSLNSRIDYKPPTTLIKPSVASNSRTFSHLTEDDFSKSLSPYSIPFTSSKVDWKVDEISGQNRAGESLQNNIGMIKPLQKNGESFKEISSMYQLDPTVSDGFADLSKISINTTPLNPTASIFSPRSVKPNHVDSFSNNCIISQPTKVSQFKQEYSLSKNNSEIQAQTSISSNFTKSLPSCSSFDSSHSMPSCSSFDSSHSVPLIQDNNVGNRSKLLSYWSHGSGSDVHQVKSCTPASTSLGDFTSSNINISPEPPINNSYSASTFAGPPPMKPSQTHTKSIFNTKPSSIQQFNCNKRQPSTTLPLLYIDASQPVDIPEQTPNNLQFEHKRGNNYNIPDSNPNHCTCGNTQRNKSYSIVNNENTSRQQQIPLEQTSSHKDSSSNIEIYDNINNLIKENFKYSYPTKPDSPQFTSNPVPKYTEIKDEYQMGTFNDKFPERVTVKDKFHEMGTFNKYDQEVVKTNSMDSNNNEKLQYGKYNHTDSSKTDYYHNDKQFSVNTRGSPRRQYQFQDKPECTAVPDRFLTSVWTNKIEQKRKPIGRNQRLSDNRGFPMGDGCSFCKSNGETTTMFMSHCLKNKYGHVECPILSKVVCPICKATGIEAHTVSYCPQTYGKSIMLKSNCTDTGPPPKKWL